MAWIQTRARSKRSDERPASARVASYVGPESAEARSAKVEATSGQTSPRAAPHVAALMRATCCYLHGYVWCDAMIAGELAHTCTHGPPPHRIKVCITKKGNEKFWRAIEAVAVRSP